VWQRAHELADPAEKRDRSAVTLELLRIADNHPAEMAHALTLGRTHLRGDADDTQARRALMLLERAIEFLGYDRPSSN
jgi:hypothetical protein